MLLFNNFFRLQRQSMITRLSCQLLRSPRRIGSQQIQRLPKSSARGELRSIYHQSFFARPPPPPFSGSNPQAQTLQSSVRAGAFVVGSFVCANVAIWLLYNQSGIQNSEQKWTRWDVQKNDRGLEWNFKDDFNCSLRNLREGRYYTLVTSAFMHHEWWHLLGNMLALWTFGRSITFLYGVPSFVALYLGGGVTGNLTSLYAMAQRENSFIEQQGIGCSSSVLSIGTALACTVPRASVVVAFIPMPMMASTILTVAFSLYAMKEGILPGIDHAGHLGGIGFGALFWLAILRRNPRVYGYYR